jgi:hypothetical protein
MTSKNKSVLEDTKQTALQQLIEKLKMDIDYYDSLLSQEDYKAYHKGLIAKKTQAHSTLDDAESLLGIEKEQIENAYRDGRIEANIPKEFNVKGEHYHK